MNFGGDDQGGLDFGKMDWFTRRMMWIMMILGRIPGPSESIQYNKETQHDVPRMQAITGVLSTMAAMIGWGLLGSQLVWVLDGEDIKFSDGVLIGTLVLIIVVFAIMVSKSFLRALHEQLRAIIGTAAALLVIAGLFVGVVGFRSRAEDLKPIEATARSLAIMLGTGLSIFPAALCYRFLSELIDPLYPKPPALRYLDELKEEWTNQQPQEGTRVLTEKVPIRVNRYGGSPQQMDRSTGEFSPVPTGGDLILSDSEYRVSDSGDEDSVLGDEGATVGFFVNPETANLIWYTMLAHEVGLSRPAATKENRLLPFVEGDDEGNRRLNKNTHKSLIDRGAKRGWWIKQGKGVAAIWNPDLGPDGVLAAALEEWNLLTDGNLDPPNPWDGREPKNTYYKREGGETDDSGEDPEGDL